LDWNGKTEVRDAWYYHFSYDRNREQEKMKAIFTEDALLENCANEGLDERLGVQLQLEELRGNRPECGDRPKDALEKELHAWRKKED
jgi:hypothetical protein